MKKLKIYLDTSVIGGYFDEEFKKYSERVIKNIKNDNIIGVISEITIKELDNATDFVKEHFITYKNKLEIIELTEEVKELARKYVDEKIVSEKYYEDALHIAFATINQIDVLVSWNFKHIVNFNKIIQFNSVNLKSMYKNLQIYSPMEVLNNEED